MDVLCIMNILRVNYLRFDTDVDITNPFCREKSAGQTDIN